MSNQPQFTKVVFITVLLLPLAILLTVIVNPALAASKKWTGAVGGVGVTAEKTLTLSRYLWNTNLYSRADSNISIIGMTYWTIEEFCPLTRRTSYYKRFGPAFDRTDRYFSRSASISYRGCSKGPSLYRSHGNHDFGGSVQPYVIVTVQR